MFFLFESGFAVVMAEGIEETNTTNIVPGMFTICLLEKQK